MAKAGMKRPESKGQNCAAENKKKNSAKNETPTSPTQAKAKNEQQQ